MSTAIPNNIPARQTPAIPRKDLFLKGCIHQCILIHNDYPHSLSMFYDVASPQLAHNKKVQQCG